MAPSHSQDLLGLFPPAPPLPTSLPPDSEDPTPGQNDTALSNISSVPGAESTRLDSSNVETSEGQINQSQISNNSRWTGGMFEDAKIFMDSKKNFHVISHVYKYGEDRNHCDKSTVSAHLYSKD